MRPTELVTHTQRLGPRVVAEELHARVASKAVNFGLRCDLTQLPPVKPASISLDLEACGPEFRGFEAELSAASGRDYGRVLRRKRLHEVGVRTLHAAFTPDREPVFVQWLVTPADQPALAEHASEYWPALGSDEVMVEFAYTFTAFRGKGVMADGMGRVLAAGARQGARSALTYVLWDNVASLRGCSKVGFRLDHVRETTIRLGRRRDDIRPPTDSERAVWERATAPKA